MEGCRSTEEMKVMVAERCSASMGRLSGKSVEVQVGLSSSLSSQKKKEQELVEVAAVSY